MNQVEFFKKPRERLWIADYLGNYVKTRYVFPEATWEKNFFQILTSNIWVPLHNATNFIR